MMKQVLDEYTICESWWCPSCYCCWWWSCRGFRRRRRCYCSSDPDATPAAADAAVGCAYAAETTAAAGGASAAAGGASTAAGGASAAAAILMRSRHASAYCSSALCNTNLAFTSRAQCFLAYAICSCL